MATLEADRSLLTIQQTAETLSISETTVRRLIACGVLPIVRVSAGAIRIERDELADWISERRTSSAVGPGSSADHASSAVGTDSSVDTPGERDGTSSSREAVEPAQLAGEEQR